MVYLTTVGKVLSFFNVLILPSYAVYNLIMNVTDPANAMGTLLASMFFLSGIVLGLVEVPTLCACYDFCKVIATYTRVLGGFWVARAGVNIGIASGLLALAAHRISTLKSSGTKFTNPWVIIIPVSMLIVGVLYLLGALWKREPPPGGEKPQSSDTELKGSGGSGGGGLAASAGGFLGGFFAKKIMENPEGAASLVKSAGPSLASSMFGGGDSSSGSGANSSSSSMFGSSKGGDSGEGGSGSGKSSPRDATGFYGDEESGKKREEKVSMFSGGGLFGGGGSGATDKAALYGVATDEDAAANPFISSL